MQQTSVTSAEAALFARHSDLFFDNFGNTFVDRLLSALNRLFDQHGACLTASLALRANVMMANWCDTVFAVRYFLLLVNRFLDRLLLGNHLANCAADFNQLNPMTASAVRTWRFIGLKGRCADASVGCRNQNEVPNLVKGDVIHSMFLCMACND